MPPVTIQDLQSGASAQILPELGFNCFHFEALVAGQKIEVLDAEADFASGGKRPSASGIPLLFPFPNRIRQGRFQWDGKDYQLPQQDAHGNAIHGFVHDRPWRVIEQGPDFVLGRFQLSVDAPDRLPLWSADFVLDVRYLVSGTALHCDLRLFNPGVSPLPWGFGTHAYFRVPLTPHSLAADCLLRVPATEAWELIDCLPTGLRVPVSGATDLRDGQSLAGLKLDDVLTGVISRNGKIESLLMDTRGGIQVSQVTCTDFPELVVYTPPHGRSVCMEPYTCVTDAINLAARGVETGWRVLAPGAEWKTRITIAAELVIA